MNSLSSLDAAAVMGLPGNPPAVPRLLSAEDMDLAAAGSSAVSLSLTAIDSKMELDRRVSVDRVYRK